MSAYLFSIGGIVLTATLVSLVLPDGKMGRCIEGALKLIALAVIIAPILRMNALSFDGWQSQEAYCDTEYNAFTQEMLYEALIYDNLRIVTRVEVVDSEKKTVTVTVKTVITEEDGHINISETIQKLLFAMGEAEVIVIWEDV